MSSMEDIDYIIALIKEFKLCEILLNFTGEMPFTNNSENMMLDIIENIMNPEVLNVCYD